jgi:hypothetical protein
MLTLENAGVQVTKELARTPAANVRKFLTLSFF